MAAPVVAGVSYVTVRRPLLRLPPPPRTRARRPATTLSTFAAGFPPPTIAPAFIRHLRAFAKQRVAQRRRLFFRRDDAPDSSISVGQETVVKGRIAQPGLVRGRIVSGGL